MQALMRRRGASSSSNDDTRWHSFLAPTTANPVLLDGRASEQIPRNEFLSPNDAPAIVRTSADGSAVARPVSPAAHEESRRVRFSMLKFRHASESQLSTKAKLHAQNEAPAIPRPPEIITTAPTLDIVVQKPSKKKSRVRLPGRTKSSMPPSQESALEVSQNEKRERRKTFSESAASGSKSRVTFDEPTRPSTSSPPAYGDDTNITLALPVNRLSESSRSDASSGEHGIYATTTTTTHTVHTTTTFFRLPRRKKAAPLFDLSHLPQKSNTPSQFDTTPTASTNNSRRNLGCESSAITALCSPSADDVAAREFASPLPSPARSILERVSSTGPGIPIIRQNSSASARTSTTRMRLDMRGRSSTLSSLRNRPIDEPLPTPPVQSTRTSTSTGRKSFGDLFGLSHRLRQNSEPPFPRGSGPATPGSNTSKNNSMQLTREPSVVPIILPERLEDDTPAKYLVRLEEAVSRGVVASVLSKGTDPFSQAVLRSYMRGFGFFGDPMDMAIRKLLMEVELPKETQQIDRCLQGFANRYHECNPGIYASPDQAYFVAFSLLILHTDVFNKNNKHKMQKPDYLKNIRGEGIFDEILECFYDNISYTPFIHVEDDLDINGECIIQHKTKKKSIFGGTVDPTKRPSKEPVDPYTLIIDSKLDTLRPNLKDVMHLEEHYSYLGTAPSLNLQDLQKTFFRTGVLQLVSARSRPDAFMSDKTVNNPDEAQAGIVDIKITKVGILWRKDAKKKKTRSPWQEWGAILTGAQLYFSRNITWIKSLMHQHENHIRQGHDGSPVIFKPPLEQFKPDALMSTDNAVALRDSTYDRHKNAFVFVRHGGFEETFLASSDKDMNDWLAKLNYAAAFRTSGVRMRGVVGGNYDGQRTRGIRRLDSQSDTSKSVQTPTGEVTIVSGKIDTKMASDILAARREIMLQKIAEAEVKLAAAQKQLDSQLRNARHLQILAPIQAKTREQVLMAAGRMAAQLKWGRMEIWRLRCHKDILTMDLEDEKPTEPVQPQDETPVSNALQERDVAVRMNSKSSAATTYLSPRPRTPDSRPSTAQPKPQEETASALDDMFQTPPLARTSSFHRAQASWELPPLNFESSSVRKASLSSVVPSSPSVTPTPSRNTTYRSQSVSEAQRPTSNPEDAAEQTALEQAGIVAVDASRPSTGPESDEFPDQVPEKDKLDRGKIRRSLHRTLREAHVPSHARSRKGKDSSSSAALSETGSKDDVLSRGTGSFVVHGKKASVITFGSELQSMSPEERLRLRKLSHKDEPGPFPSSAFEDGFDSVLAEPYECHERHGSTATTSTTTARSFRDLHRKLASYSANSQVVSDDGDDSEAFSYSEGRRTPLAPVEDEVDNRGSRPASQGKQAIFYSPEPSSSPVTVGFEEKPKTSADLSSTTEAVHDAERENERLPSPPVQLVSA